LDMVVDNRVIIEIKATEKLPAFASRQLINYLHVTPFRLGLLFTSDPKPSSTASSIHERGPSARSHRKSWLRRKSTIWPIAVSYPSIMEA
jgi:hypothetical protein